MTMNNQQYICTYFKKVLYGNARNYILMERPILLLTKEDDMTRRIIMLL